MTYLQLVDLTMFQRQSSSLHAVIGIYHSLTGFILLAFDSLSRYSWRRAWGSYQIL